MSLLKKIMSEYSLNWSDLYYFRRDIENIHEAEKRLLTNTEEFAHKLHLEFNKKKDEDETLNKLKESPDEYEELYAGYYDHKFGRNEEVISTIIQSHRRSTVLSLYSLIEGQLKVLTEIIEARFKFKLTIDDLAGGDDLHQVWLYLTKVFELEGAKLEPYFTPIKQQKYIRNKIAHNNAKVDKRLEYVRGCDGIRLDTFSDTHYIFFENDSFNANLLESSSIFFKKLIKEVDARYSQLVTEGR